VILLKSAILEGVRSGDIYINPYDEDQVGPNSYDVRLGDTLKIYDLSPEDYLARGLQLLDADGNPIVVQKPTFLDPKAPVLPTLDVHIPPEGLVLHPSLFYLGHTIEKAGSDKYVPHITGRSSIARLGLEIHQTAGFGDIGYKAQWTLELKASVPVKVYPGMKIGQVYFEEGLGEVGENLYDGKYVEAEGAVASKISEDFK
jgi:dCTP deaminase